MNATHKIKIDLVRKGVKPRVEAMQYDTNSRVVEIMLMANGAVWMPPSAGAFALSYRKPDGTRGFYNKLDDDTSAITVSENTVSVILAHQVLTVPGEVDAALVVNDDEMDRLTSFPFEINVTADPSAGTTESDDYFNCATYASMVYLNKETSVSTGGQYQLSITSTVTGWGDTFSIYPKVGDLVISTSGQLFQATSVTDTEVRLKHLTNLRGTAEDWIFTLEDGSTVTKAVYVG